MWQWAFSAFGDEKPTLAKNRFANLEVTPNPGITNISAVDFKLRFPGQIEDKESGLYYNGRRSYSSGGGFYTQNDPIGLAGGFNRRTYVSGNPLRYTDPDGLQQFLPTPIGPLPIPLPPAPAGAPSSLDPENPYPLGAPIHAPSLWSPALAIPSAIMAGCQALTDWMLSDGGKKDTLQPGPNSGESVPARGPGRDFTSDERGKINDIGRDTGCHTCGTKDAGTPSGNFIPDHQPPNALNPDAGAQNLYPHCIGCSRTQGGQVRARQQRGG